jgi:hypothetical protein
MNELRMKRILWQEYGIVTELSFVEVGRALRLHNLEAKRAENLRTR